MGSKTEKQAYLDGFRTVKQVLELDSLIVEEILLAINADRESDHALTPWKRGYRAGIRVAFGG